MLGAKRIPTFLVAGAVAALIAVATAPETGRAESDAEAGKRLAEQLGCPQCHRADGIPVDEGIPNLAGQKRGFLIRTLMHLKLGTVRADDEVIMHREHPVMTNLARRLSAERIKDLAAYYSDLTCTDPPGRNPALAPPKGVEHCVACHGGMDRGNPWTDTPYLAGQDRIYLRRQTAELWNTRENGELALETTDRFHRLTEVMFFPAHRPYLLDYADYFASLSCSTGRE